MVQGPIENDQQWVSVKRLFGSEGFAQIQRAWVVLIGVGGVGSWTAEALARSGVGRLTLIDGDHIALSNINRQLHANYNTHGQAKPLAMAERIASYRKSMVIDSIESHIDLDNAANLIHTDADAIVDACDSVKAKLITAQHALQQQQKLFISGAAGGKFKAHLTQVNSLDKVTHDRLLARLRYELKRTGLQSINQLICVHSKEQAQIPITDEFCAADSNFVNNLNCQGYGSSAAVTASFGMVLAGLALDYLISCPKKN